MSGTSSGAKIKVDGPKNVTAVWKTDYTQAYITLGVVSVIAILAVVGSIVFLRKRCPLDATASESIASAPTSMKYCISCGVSIPSDSESCGKCGSAQE